MNAADTHKVKFGLMKSTLGQIVVGRILLATMNDHGEICANRNDGLRRRHESIPTTEGRREHAAVDANEDARLFLF
jgi:hypothetical protein